MEAYLEGKAVLGPGCHEANARVTKSFKIVPVFCGGALEKRERASLNAVTYYVSNPLGVG
jgi:hypothetical protein